MDVGSLRERITIQKPSVVVDAIGGQTEGAPTMIAENLPAAVDALGIGQERLQVGQLRGVVSKRVRIRQREDITDDMLILWRNSTLEIGLVDIRYDVYETHLYCAKVQ